MSGIKVWTENNRNGASALNVNVMRVRLFGEKHRCCSTSSSFYFLFPAESNWGDAVSQRGTRSGDGREEGGRRTERWGVVTLWMNERFRRGKERRVGTVRRCTDEASHKHKSGLALPPGHRSCLPITGLKWTHPFRLQSSLCWHVIIYLPPRPGSVRKLFVCTQRLIPYTSDSQCSVVFQEHVNPDAFLQPSFKQDHLTESSWDLSPLRASVLGIIHCSCQDLEVQAPNKEPSPHKTQQWGHSSPGWTGEFRSNIWTWGYRLNVKELKEMQTSEVFDGLQTQV